METALFIVLVLAVMVAVVIYVPRYFMKKAMREVVSLFRAKGATTPKTAATLQELGLVRPGLVERMTKPRDYRLNALNLLGQANVVIPTSDGRLYLSEEDLENSPIKQFAQIE